jgi:hypothetical protein
MSSVPVAPRALWVLWGAFFGILLGYSVLVPLIRSPDERLHVDLILAIEGGRYGWDPEGGVMTERGEAANAALGSWVQPKTAANATPRAARPVLNELGGLGPGERANWQRQHPPLYYAALGSLADVHDGRVDQHVWLLRLLNALLASLLVPLGYAAAATVTDRTGVRVLAAASLAAIPQLAHIGASVNNDNLLNLLAAGALVLALRVARHGITTGRLVGLGLLIGLALLTKHVAFAVLPSAVLAIVARGRRDGAPMRAVRRQVAAMLAVAFAAGGWWWLRNLVVHGTPLPSSHDQMIEPGVRSPDAWTWLRAFVDRVDRSYWGELGSLEVEIPWWVAWFATAAVLAVVVAALRRPGARLQVAVGLLPMAVALVGLLAVTWRAPAVDGRFPGLQGRYLFVGVLGVVVAVAAAVDGMTARQRSRAGWALAGSILVMHAVTVRAALEWFYGGPALGLDAQLEGLLAWSPAAKLVTGGVLLALGLGVLGAAATAQWAASAERQRQAVTTLEAAEPSAAAWTPESAAERIGSSASPPCR